MTPPLIARLKKLEAEATPSNWPNWNDPDIRKQTWMHFDLLQDRESRTAVSIPDDDALLIAESRNALPKLLEAIEIATEKLAEIEHMEKRQPAGFEATAALKQIEELLK